MSERAVPKRAWTNSVVLLAKFARHVTEGVASFWFIGQANAMSDEATSLLFIGQLDADVALDGGRHGIRSLVTFKSDDPSLGAKGKALQDLLRGDVVLGDDPFPRAQEDFVAALTSAITEQLRALREREEGFHRVSFVRLTSEG